jgi:hypothetical protein
MSPRRGHRPRITSLQRQVSLVHRSGLLASPWQCLTRDLQRLTNR